MVRGRLSRSLVIWFWRIIGFYLKLEFPRMNPTLSSLLIAIPFVGLYFIGRSIPVSPCDFLHEETYNTDGVIDYCGPGDSGFIDLTLRKWPLTLDFDPPQNLSPGQNRDFEVKISQFDGSPLGGKDVALSHNKKIHLLAVDESLTDYHHIHPEPDSIFDGTWRFSLTPKYSGKYVLFFDFIPSRSPRRVLLNSSFFVDGSVGAESASSEKLLHFSGARKFSLSKLEDSSDDEGLKLLFRVTDEQDNLVALSPVMGAFAHLVAFEPNLKGFAHLHPLESVLPENEKDVYEGALTFTFSPPKAGLYRLWAQVRIGDEPETFVPFDLKTGI